MMFSAYIFQNQLGKVRCDYRLNVNNANFTLHYHLYSSSFFFFFLGTLKTFKCTCFLTSYLFFHTSMYCRFKFYSLHSNPAFSLHDLLHYWFLMLVLFNLYEPTSEFIKYYSHKLKRIHLENIFFL